MSKKIFYPGWELSYFDKANNFRNYQYNLIKKYIRGVVAEIGPGNGTTAKQYFHLVKKLYLFEPSKNLYKFLKKKFSNKKIFVKNQEFKNRKLKYDTIILLDVLEHIKNDIEIILRTFNSLKVNGNIIINVPAYKLLYSNFDRDVGHYKRYENKDINIIIENLKLKKKKFKIIFFYYDIVGFILSLISKLFSNSNYKLMFEKKIFFWNKLIFISKILDKMTLNRIGKSLCIIIKKI